MEQERLFTKSETLAVTGWTAGRFNHFFSRCNTIKPEVRSRDSRGRPEYLFSRSDLYKIAIHFDLTSTGFKVNLADMLVAAIEKSNLDAVIEYAIGERILEVYERQEALRSFLKWLSPQDATGKVVALLTSKLEEDYNKPSAGIYCFFPRLKGICSEVFFWTELVPYDKPKTSFFTPALKVVRSMFYLRDYSDGLIYNLAQTMGRIDYQIRQRFLPDYHAWLDELIGDEIDEILDLVLSQ